MKITTTLIIVVFIISCDGYGDIIHKQGKKLLFIEYKDDRDKWTEQFSYDSLDRLVFVTDTKTSIGRKYFIEYADDRIRQVRTFTTDTDEEIKRDSIAYSATGKIERVTIFNGNSLEPVWTYEYEYDTTGNLCLRKTLFYDPLMYGRFEKYFWENGNVVRMEEYNQYMELYYEFFYSYDDKVNYKNILPYGIGEPFFWSRNNLIKGTWNDYNGDLESRCNPCIFKYDYNLDGYPVKILDAGDRKLVLEYE